MGSALNPERGVLDVYCHPNVVFPEAEAGRSLSVRPARSG